MPRAALRPAPRLRAAAVIGHARGGRNRADRRASRGAPGRMGHMQPDHTPGSALCRALGRAPGSEQGPAPGRVKARGQGPVQSRSRGAAGRRIMPLALALLLALPAPLGAVALAEPAPAAAPDRTVVAKATGNAAAGKDAAPNDARVWVIAHADDTYVLRYGAPGAPDPVFAVACQRSAGLLQFTVEVASAKISSGDGVALSLAAGKRRLELAASAFRGEAEGQVVAEAAVALDRRVLDLFAEGETLTVRLPGASTSFPLAAARAKLGDFRQACFARR